MANVYTHTQSSHTQSSHSQKIKKEKWGVEPEMAGEELIQRRATHKH